MCLVGDPTFVVDSKTHGSSECAFLDTSEWAQERTLNQLPAFLERFTKQSRKALSKAPERMGSPHTIVITMAGIRAADVTR